MRGNSRAILVSVALLSAAVFNLGCNQIFGLDETEPRPNTPIRASACSGGGQSFSLDNDVCLLAELNPGINPDLPEDFRRRRTRCKTTATSASSATWRKWHGSAWPTEFNARATPWSI